METPYIIVQESPRDGLTLADMVNVRVADGYVPIGSPYYLHDGQKGLNNIQAQAMFKDPNREEMERIMYRACSIYLAGR